MSDDRLAHFHASALHRPSKPDSCRAEWHFPCSEAPDRWLSAFKSDQDAAALGCQDCPVATACLLYALRLHAAHTRCEDPYGVAGIYGGVWFEPGQEPRNIRPVTAEEARAAHAARWRLTQAGEDVPDDIVEADRAYTRRHAHNRRHAA